MDGTVEEGPTPSVLRESVRGGVTTVAARGGADAVRLVAMLVLARLLSPAEFGVVAIVLVAVGLAQVIQNLGLSAAAIQREHLSLQESSTLFWINVGLGTAGSLCVYFAADAIADFVADPRVSGTARLLAPMFLLNALAAQHLALMRRALRFTTIALIRITEAVVYGAVAVALAAAGMDQNSMVWGLLVSGAVVAVASYAASPMVPRRPRWTTSIAEMTRFGLGLTAFAVLGFLATNIQAIAIGRADGTGATGLFGRAQRLAQVSTGYVLQPVDGVAYPVMSRLVAEPARWEEYYRQAQRIVAIATLALAPILSVHAGLAVEVLLGPEWSDSAPVLALLSIALLATALCHPTGWIYQSRGDTTRLLRWGVFGWSVVLAGTLAGVPFGINGVAAGYAIACALLIWPCMAYAFAGTNLTPASVSWSIAPVLGAAAAACVFSVAAVSVVPGAAPSIRLVVATGSYLAVYGAVLLALPRERQLLLTVRAQLRPVS